MKEILLFLSAATLCAATLYGNYTPPRSQAEDVENIMPESYWKQWNSEVQKKIDADIDANRKADATIKLENADPNSEVQIEQITHHFIFGAHIFNYNQLGSKEVNNRYKNLFGTFFNSATVAFYWMTFEMQPNRPRFSGEYWDSEEFWNNIDDPKSQPHWRRPPTDPVIAFCKERGVRIHGHPLVWGSRKFQHPLWTIQDNMTPEEKSNMDKILKIHGGWTGNGRSRDVFIDEASDYSPEKLEELFPQLGKKLKKLFEKRIVEIANYYGDTVDSWDVVNESCTAYSKGSHTQGKMYSKLKGEYGIMPGDYVYDAFKVSAREFPESVKLNINDYKVDEFYSKQITELLGRGAKIDIVGAQMHFLKKSEFDAAFNGDENQKAAPNEIWALFERIGKTNIPLHMSEITVPSAGDGTSERDKKIQAIMAANLYRIWFSGKPVMGITWWNVLDDCAVKNEPSVSGLFTRDMKPKPAFDALNNLIYKEWFTKLSTKPDAQGKVNFRGFRGKYNITWKDKNGQTCKKSFYLN